MTQLEKKSHDAQMPSIGIFWYDMEDKSFWGVEKSELNFKGG